jgi:prephenate dehydrogenase
VVAVAGLGLIGGSLARALTRAGWRVVGFDADGAVRRRARRARAVAEAPPSLERAVEGADVVVLAAPPAANVRLLRRLDGRGLLVTDVGSVKGPICRVAATLRGVRFVGGHPVAGNEGRGFAAGDASLFSGRAWVLTPGARTAPRDLAAVARLARAAGARPVLMRPAEHDRALAYLSHLPQLVAWALLDAARRDAVAGRHLAAAGPGFRDMTRLAHSPPALWRDVLAGNAAPVRRALRAFARALRRLQPPAPP